MIRCTVTEKSGAVWLQLAGRLDSMTSPEVQQRINGLIQDGARTMVVDMEQVGFMSSAGLRVFMLAQKQLKKAGGQIVVYRMLPQVREVFAMSGFDGLFSMAETPDDVAAAVQGAAASAEAAVREINGIRFEYLSQPSAPPAHLQIVGSQEKLPRAAYRASDVVRVRSGDMRFGTGLAASGGQGTECMSFFGEAVVLDGSLFFYPALKRPAVDFMLCSGPETDLTYDFLYGAGFSGPFRYVAAFEHTERFVTLAELADGLCELSDAPALGIVLLAESKGLWGMHLKQVPCVENAPSAGDIFDEEHFADWMNFPVEPVDIGGVIAGAGIVLREPAAAGPDLSALVPAGSRLHLHAAVFAPEPLNRTLDRFDQELRRAITEFEVCRVQHLLDKSLLASGMVGVVELGLEA